MAAGMRTYDPAAFERLRVIDDRHFWFLGRNRILASVLRGLAGDFPAGSHVLEVGCGNGNTLRVLERECGHNVVVGMDLFMEGLRHARERTSCFLVQGDIRKLPFARQFQMICFFDVLEHLPDDRGALEALRAILAPGGVIVVTVPARKSLWSEVDERGSHLRRYEAEELNALLDSAGYQVGYLTPFMMSIYPLFWVSRRLGPMRAGRKRQDAPQAAPTRQDELQVIPVLNGVLTFTLGLEATMVGRRLKLPFGTSLLAVAKARDEAKRS